MWLVELRRRPRHFWRGVGAFLFALGIVTCVIAALAIVGGLLFLVAIFVYAATGSVVVSIAIEVALCAFVALATFGEQ